MEKRKLLAGPGSVFIRREQGWGCTKGIVLKECRNAMCVKEERGYKGLQETCACWRKERA